MDRVVISVGDWTARAYLARTFTDRLLGNRRLPRDSALVLPTRSVHSFGQREPIEIVGLDALMTVVAAKTLMPNRISVMPSARMIVELPCGSPVPSLDDRIVMTRG